MLRCMQLYWVSLCFIQPMNTVFLYPIIVVWVPQFIDYFFIIVHDEEVIFQAA